MPWLTRDDEVLATIDVGRRHRRRGERAVVLHRPIAVCALRSPGLDVAWCRRDGASEDAETVEVRKVVTLGPTRPFLPCLLAPAVIVAGAGSFERWRVRVGDHLAITGD